MPTMTTRTLLLHTGKVPTTTIQAILDAEDGAMIAVDPVEMDHILPLVLHGHPEDEDPKAAKKWKTVLLYNRRRVQPDTMQAILDAEEGAMIPVDPGELDHFLQLVIFERAVAKATGQKKTPKEKQA